MVSSIKRDKNKLMKTLRMQQVIICRSNPVAPDPRVEKLAEVLYQAGYEVLILAWDRTGQLPGEEERSEYRIVRFSRITPYGLGLRKDWD